MRCVPQLRKLGISLRKSESKLRRTVIHWQEIEKSWSSGEEKHVKRAHHCVKRQRIWNSGLERQMAGPRATWLSYKKRLESVNS
jgi:hypothetical protein